MKKFHEGKELTRDKISKLYRGSYMSAPLVADVEDLKYVLRLLQM